jgi:hypothetical protein
VTHRRAPHLLAALLSAALAGCTTQVVCTSDQVTVNGRCISLASDPLNCGDVGHVCGGGQSCSGSQCCSGQECAAAVYAACANGNSVQGATAALVPVGAPVAVETRPIALAWRGNSLWVATSIGNTLDRTRETTAGLAPDGPFPTVNVPISGSFADLEFLAEHDGLLYVSNAAAGSLLVVDLGAPQPIVGEIPLGAFTNPQGIAFQGSRAYVALNGSGELAVVDLVTRTVAKRIDLSAMGTVAGGALPARVAVQGDVVVVTLWNLDPTDFKYTPAGPGRLAIVDARTDDLVPSVNPVSLGTACENPGDVAFLGTTAWVTCGFVPWTAKSAAEITGAAIVPVDLSVALSGIAPVVGTPVRVTGAVPGALAFCGGIGYVADNYGGSLLRLDPAALAVTTRGVVCAPVAGAASLVADVACGR